MLFMPFLRFADFFFKKKTFFQKHTAADNKLYDLLIFLKNKVWYFMKIACQKTILMKYHALFVIFEKAANFENVVCCKL